LEYRTLAIGAINSTYKHVFRKDISGAAARFMRNLAYVVSGTLPSIVLLSVFNILAARFLGPTEYGKYTLIQSVAAFIGISMIMGYHTTIAKFLPENDNFESQSKTISSVYILTLLFTVVTVVLCILFMPEISSIFNISKEFLTLAIAFAVMFTFYTLTTNTIRGLLKMKLYSLFQVAYAVMVLMIFLAFVVSGPITFESILYPVFISYGITAVAVFLMIRKYLVLKIDMSWISRLTKYSLFCVIGAMSFTFYSNIDKILININLTPSDLGIYGAYSLAAISVTSLMLGTFISVFFPTASQYKDKGPIFKMFFRLLPFLVVLGIPFLIVCEVGVLWLYGKQYTLYPDLVVLFSIAGVSQSIQNLYGWILNTDSNTGVKISSVSAVFLAGADLVLNIILIPVFGVRGAVIAITLSYLATFLIMIGLTKRYYRSGDAVAGN
jgi:O-antigen/teichoic acid export membrane protein